MGLVPRIWSQATLGPPEGGTLDALFISKQRIAALRLIQKLSC